MDVAERMRARVARWGLVATAGLSLLALGGCGSSGGGATANVSTGLALNTVPWCGGQSLLAFQDDSTTAQSAVTDWAQVKSQLGFTPYLPPTLPKGACLALAGGSIHDPIYGGHLSVTYIVPKVGPVSFSEAPVRQGQASTLECVTSSEDKTTSICLGVQNKTTITLASKQPAADLERFFKTLQPQANWAPSPVATATAPASKATGTAKPAATATSSK